MKDETDPGPINDTQMTPMDEITERPEFKDDIKMDQDLDMKVTIKELVWMEYLKMDPRNSRRALSTERWARQTTQNPKKKPFNRMTKLNVSS